MGKEMVRTTLCVGLLASCLVLLPVFSGSAFASTTPGSLTLSSTFDSISVRASFTGDPNGNNSASITLTKSVATISPAAPVSGAQLFVDAGASSGGNGSSASPFNSIPAAVSAATAGTTIQVRPGTYPPFTISKAGTASGYIAIVGDARDQVLISGGGGNNINVSGSFIQLKNLRLRQSNNSSINVQSNSHHIWIENIYHENISASRSYGDAGVLIGDNTHNVYVLSNEFYSQSLTDFDIPGDAWDQAGAAIYINSSPNSQGTFVFKGNIIKAGFRDCIGNSTESWGNGTIDNSDIAYNYVTGCKDDAIQMEGDDVNLRIFGNIVDANVGWSTIALEPALVGPVYVFRNVLKLHSSHDAYAAKMSGTPAYVFWIHNTIDTTGGSGASDGIGGGGTKPFQFLYNNIIRTSGIGVDSVASTSNANGNLYLCSGTYFNNWGGGTYTSVSALRSATGNEVNGKQGDALFLDLSKLIGTNSPAYNAGILLANFNTSDSAWPFLGSAPDIGAYEVGADTRMPAPPQTLLLR